MKKLAYIIIPAYQPSNVLFELVRSLVETAYKSQKINAKIIIVNDGSSLLESIQVLENIATSFKQVIVLNHKKNAGKGSALKTGFSYIRDNSKYPSWVVTADADGQHLCFDIWSIVEAGISEQTPVIGSRGFNVDMPLRSRLGNTITHLLFNLMHKIEVSDTQTGLRGFNSKEITSLLELKSDGYAFELDALIYFAEVSQVREITITTVYEPGNPTSHFRPILDSIAIYAVLFRQIMASMFAMFFEVILFFSFSFLGLSIALALPAARLISGSALFLLARNFVFQSNGNTVFQASKYICLIIINLFISVMIINFCQNMIGINKISGLFISYIIMFLINFIIQKYIIFNRI